MLDGNMETVQKIRRQPSLSFGGCGFLGVYHIGAIKCIQDHAPHLLDDFKVLYGTSAGSVAAVYTACKLDVMIAFKAVKKMFEASRTYCHLGALHPSFDIYSYLRVLLEEFLPVDAHKLTRGKLKISLTVLSSLDNWLVCNFTTRKELINAVIASSFIPGYAGVKDLPVFRGKRCFDGGFSSNIPCAYGPDVVTVSPFGGGCDICPRDDSQSPYFTCFFDQPWQMSTSNLTRLSNALLPSSWVELEDVFHGGYGDALRFFKNDGLFADTLTHPIARQQTFPTTQSVLSNDDISSDYFSMSGESTPLYRSRSQSLADMFSCLEEDSSSSDRVEECSCPHSSLSTNQLESLQEKLMRLQCEGR